MSFGDGTPGNGQGQTGAAPWSADLEQRFPDETVRAQVDAYLRERQQPRMTQLEQEAAQARQQYEATENARNLWEALETDASSTMAAMISQLYDEETAQRALSALSGEQGPEAQAAAQQAVQADAMAAQQAPVSPLTPEQQRLLDNLQWQEQVKTYNANIDAELSKEQNKDLDADLLRENIHPFVQAADGDMTEAFNRYRNFVSRFGQPASADEVANAAPPVLDNQGAAENGMGQEVRHTWDSAFESLEADLQAQRGHAPPPVGVA